MRKYIEELRFQKVFLANLEDLNPKISRRSMPPDTLTTLVLLD